MENVKVHINQNGNQGSLLQNWQQMKLHVYYKGVIEIDKQENYFDIWYVNNIKKLKILALVNIIITIQEQKLGIAIGVTKELSNKISAVELVKIGSSVLGGKGGGGRDDFAQAGGEKIEKIDESYKEILKKIN